MKIYLGHATSFDYENELYAPFKKSKLMQDHEMVLPHSEFRIPWSTLDVIKSCDLFIAEVSYPSTGLGIELGWANIFNRQILCIHKTGITPSAALKIITNHCVEYNNIENLIKKIIENKSSLTIDII